MSDKKTQFLCDKCGKQAETWTAWYKKRKNHYCSRQCKDAHHKELYGSGLERKEYEKQYWSKPENAARRKIASKLSSQRRMAHLGESYKKAMHSRCKFRAEKKGIEFDIEVDDIEIPEFCPILGTKLKANISKGGDHNSPSLDRIDPSKGYVKGNVHVISKRANVIKSDATEEEVRKVADWMAQFINSRKTLAA